MSVLLVVLACESLHVCTVCIWRSKHAKGLCGSFLCAIYKFSFIHSLVKLAGRKKKKKKKNATEKILTKRHQI